MSYSIRVQNQALKYRISEARVVSVTRKILRALGWKSAAVNLLLVTDKKIRRMNKRYLGHDDATDVISFSQWEGPGPRARLQKGMPLLGDVVLSLESVKRQAAEYENSFDYELFFCICHGILHLLGRDDKTARGAAWMERKQKQVLKKTGIRNLKSQ